MATFTNGISQPVCQNCQTSTTPLWRRDESGAVLCNACGLFLKLHGSPRPISLKTDIIKSRNRVKTGGLQGLKRKAPYENGLPASQSQNPHIALAQQGLQNINAHSFERTGSPLAQSERANTPRASQIAPQHVFDAASLADHAFNPGHAARQPSPISSTNAEGMLSYEQLLQQNTILKTRVSELEVINGLYQETVHQNRGQGQQSVPVNVETPRSTTDKTPTDAPEGPGQREMDLERQVKDLEQLVSDLRNERNASKRARPSGTSEYPEPPSS